MLHAGLTALEQAVMEMLLRGDDPTLSILREQLQRASVASRDMTGVGFMTVFSVSDDVPRTPKDSFAFGDVKAELSGLQNGAGFVVFVRAGKLDSLEGHTYDEPWPAGEFVFKLKYNAANR